MTISQHTGGQGDLFAAPDRYPAAPGFKSAGTSQEAAEAIKPSASKVRALVLDEFRSVFPAGLSADQVAGILGRSPLYIRPRVSELKAHGFVEPTVRTVRNKDTGLAARVWRATALAMEQR